MKKLICLTVFVLLAGMVRAPGALPSIAHDPYVGAIVIDATTGETLFEDNADKTGYPASMLKLMDMLIVLERIQSGAASYETPITASAAASNMGGSQVYLKEHEVFPLEEMLYALMIQSANDAALAIAEHFAGAKEGFVHLMNEKAAALGLTSTRFFSPHGLPPSEGQSPDVTTARDFAKLCRELCKYPEIFRFTSTRERGFRDNTFIMRTHNNLLGVFPGCDGFKTGYFRSGGYSIAATAEREGRRVIAVVMGSTTKQIRDAKTSELLSIGIAKVMANPAPVVKPVPRIVEQAPTMTEEADDLEAAEVEEKTCDSTRGGFWLGLLTGLAIAALIAVVVKMKQNRARGDVVRRP